MLPRRRKLRPGGRRGPLADRLANTAAADHVDSSEVGEPDRGRLTLGTAHGFVSGQGTVSVSCLPSAICVAVARNCAATNLVPRALFDATAITPCGLACSPDWWPGRSLRRCSSRLL